METLAGEQVEAGVGRSDDFKGLCKVGGFAAFGLILYTLATIAVLAIVGNGVPPTATDVFNMLHTHRVEGLLRLDLLTIIAMPLYYLLFLGLFAALRRVDRASAIVSMALVFAGVTLVLATPAPLSMLTLSDRYAAATSDAVKMQLQAAGEAILASDMWHGTGAILGGVLMQCGAVLMCFVMLRGGVFSKATAWLGIAMHTLDLAHILLGLFVPIYGAILLAIAGPLYPIWFFLVGRTLMKVAPER